MGKTWAWWAFPVRGNARPELLKPLDAYSMLEMDCKARAPTRRLTSEAAEDSRQNSNQCSRTEWTFTTSIY